MIYLFYLLLLIFPLGQLLRGLYINDFLTTLVVLVWLIAKRPKYIFNDPLFKPLVYFAFAITLSLLVNHFRYPREDLLAASLYGIRFIIYAGLYFVAKDLAKNRETIFKMLEIAVVAVAGVGLLQFIFIPDVSFLKVNEWDDHYFRLISTFLDPGFTGAILVLGMILVFARKSILKTAFLYLALALTYSRASYLMYLTSFTTIAWFQKSTKLFVIAVIALMVTIPLLPASTGEGTKLQRENSIFARLNNWKQTISVWKKNPLLGIGFNTYRYETNVAPESHSGGADNSLLLVLATTGTLGFAAYVFLLKKTWEMGDVVFKASLAGVIIHSMFNNTLFYPWVMEWLWILLALRSRARISS